MKIFDYKFLILLGLTLVVYFLYREVEILKKKVKKINKLENNDSNEKNSSNDNLILKEKNNDIIQIDLPPKPEIDEKEKNEIKLIENIVKNIEEDGNIENNNSDYQSDLKVINIPLKLQNEENEIVKEEILNDTSSNSENDNIRDYSNTSEQLEIYSNDDEANEDSSIIQSLEEIPKKKTEMDSFEGSDNRLEESENRLEEKQKLSIDNLLKNKLAELQNMAKDLNIITTKKENGKNKKKTKLELAKDIISNSE